MYQKNKRKHGYHLYLLVLNLYNFITAITSTLFFETDALTCLTLQVCITRCTLTQIAFDLIYTGTAVLTGGTDTLVYVLKKSNT